MQPEDLFRQAQALIDLRKGYKSNLGLLVKSSADGKRAISSVYYAVFHAVLNEAALLVVAPFGAFTSDSPLFSLVYRSIEHRNLRELCVELSKNNLKPAFQKYIPAGGFDPNLKDFCNTYIDLYELRMLADYEPKCIFGPNQAEVSLKAARTAIDRFRGLDAETKKTFLTLLMFRPR